MIDTREGVRERNARLKREAAETRDVIVKVMSTNVGRRWIADLLAMCHIYQDCLGTDARSSAFLLGERNVGLRLQADILAACPDYFLEMLREQGDRNGRRTDTDAGDDPSGRASTSGNADSGDDD
jgi:hypothetical protein